MTTQEMRRAVCAWARQCYAEKLFAGTSGNLSVYDRERDLMVITPTSVPYEGMTPEERAEFESEYEGYLAETESAMTPEGMSEQEREMFYGGLDRSDVMNMSLSQLVEYYSQDGRTPEQFAGAINERIEEEAVAIQSQREFDLEAEMLADEMASCDERLREENGIGMEVSVNDMPAYLAQQMNGDTPAAVREEGRRVTENAENRFQESMRSLNRDVYTLDQAHPGVVREDLKTSLEGYADYESAPDPGPGFEDDPLPDIPEHGSPAPAERGTPSLGAAMDAFDFSRQTQGRVRMADLDLERQEREAREREDRDAKLAQPFKTPPKHQGRALPAGYEQFNSVEKDPSYGFDEGEFS